MIQIAALCAPFEGTYRFVQLEASGPAAKRQVRSLGGTLTFDASGEVRTVARMGFNEGEAAPHRASGRFRYFAPDRELVLANPAQPSKTLRARVDDRAGILIGSAAQGSEDVHSLLIAVRAPQGPVSSDVLKGDYTGVYSVIRDGKVSGLATALFELSADGRGRIPSLSLIGHAAGIDDVNRREPGKKAEYKIKDDGSGVVAFPPPSDLLKGEREIFASGDGALWIGYSTRRGERDILIAVRKPEEAVTYSFRGLFWMSEIYTEGEFVFRPETARISSAAGWMWSDASGRAFLSQWVNQAGRRVRLQTAHHYRLWAAGNMFGPAVTTGVTNFAVSAGGDAFIGAQVGKEKDLTLQHGVFAGIRMREPESGGDPVAPVISTAGLVTAGASATPVLGLAPGGLYLLRGRNLSAKATVLVNGEPASVIQASGEQIDFLAPARMTGATVSLQVTNNGRASEPVEVPVVSSTPILMSSEVAGQTVTLHATGLGAVKQGQIVVRFDGKPGKIISMGPQAEKTGVMEIKVALPENIPADRPLAVSIETPDAISDVAELATGRL